MKDTGFSLASIFFLTTVVAVIASGVRMAYSGPGPIDLAAMTMLGFLGVTVGTTVGGFVASGSERSGAARALAVFAGAALGPPSVILAISGDTLPAMVVGSVVLFAFVWVVRRLSSSPSDGEPW